MKKKTAAGKPAKKPAKKSVGKTVKKPVKTKLLAIPSATAWIVTAVDTGDTCDGKARVLGAFATEQGAKDYVRSDMDRWIKRNAPDKDDKEDLVVDYAKMSASLPCGDGCEWNVERVALA